MWVVERTTMSRFDPVEGEPYGVCATCDIALATREDADAHRTATLPADGGFSHSTRARNPTREERVQHMVDDAVQAAISDALDDVSAPE